MNDQKREAAKERKRRQRLREQEAGLKEVRLKLSPEEARRLEELCRVRAGLREPYELGDYVALLIDRDWKAWQVQLAELKTQRCPKCDASLPEGCDGVFSGDSACFHTWPNWKELAL